MAFGDAHGLSSGMQWIGRNEGHCTNTITANQCA